MQFSIYVGNLRPLYGGQFLTVKYVDHYWVQHAQLSLFSTLMLSFTLRYFSPFQMWKWQPQ